MTQTPEPVSYKLFIGGAWENPSSGEWLETANPFTGKTWALIPRGNAQDADRAVAAAHVALTSGEWPALSASARGELLHRLGRLIERDADHLAAVETRDNGKPIAETGMQMRYLPKWYSYFGGLADKVEGAVIPVEKTGMFNYTRHEPIGVVAAITAWNSPLLLTTYKLAPALAAGCTVVVKPSEYTSASMLEFCRLIEEAGFPAGVVNVVTGLGAEVGEVLTGHPLVAKVAFTGGETAGQRIYGAAAQGLKPVTLELGGKSPNIVFADANMAEAVSGAVAGIFAASGQTCIAGSRLLLQDSIHDVFLEELVRKTRTIRMGDPLDPRTHVGPMATEAQYERVMAYIELARQEGARCVLGGVRATRPECGDGLFIEPTILADVDNGMRVVREEIFGPVLSVLRFHDEDEAIAIANDSPYGLAAGVWTGDTVRALRMADRLQAGVVWVNTFRTVSYMSPFGGYKRSGLGRENGQNAIHEYLQTKSIWLAAGASIGDPFVMR